MRPARSTRPGRTSRRGPSPASVLLTFVLIVSAGVVSAIPPHLERRPLDEALAVTVDREADPKAYWQERYRTLLRQREIETLVIERERELYADANRRNYRRGRKRHVHRDAMHEAMVRRGLVEERLDAFREEARRAGVLPGWLYEVEETWRDVPIAAPVAVYETEDELPEELEGRNPLYFEDPAAPEPLDVE